MSGGMRPAGDWHHDPDAKEWLGAVIDEMVPKLEESVLSLNLVPHKHGKTTEGDVKYWVELGATIMMDKPLVVVVEGQQKIPRKLRQIADEIVRLQHPLDDPRGAKQLSDAMKRIVERFPDDA